MKTAERVLDVLESFLKQEGEIGVSELAVLSNLNVSTTHRIASILVKRGYLKQLKKGAKYALSPKLLEFNLFITNVVKIGEIAFPFLLQLNKQINESVNLAVLDRDEAVNIEHVESSHSLRSTTQIGTHVPLHSTAIGKVLLAYMPDEEVEKFFNGRKLKALTENTITKPGRLREELPHIKREGIAIDDEENGLGVRCVASPIKDIKGDVIATISVSGPSVRLNNRRMQELMSLVHTYAMDISRTIGYRSK